MEAVPCITGQPASLPRTGRYVVEPVPPPPPHLLLAAGGTCQMRSCPTQQSPLPSSTWQDGGELPTQFACHGTPRVHMELIVRI